MKKLLIFTLSYLLCTVFPCREVRALEDYNTVMKRDILSLFLAYPEHVTGVEKSAEGNVYVILKSGKRILYDDKKQKTHDEKLNNPDIQDMLEQPYPLDSIDELPDVNFDPGRGRIYNLLHEVYGSNQGTIERNLTNCNGWQFNKQNGAAEALKAVLKDVNEASKTNGKIGGFVYPINGTYNYRYVSGTGRLSPHAFAIAIDIKSHPHDYWKWNTRSNGEKRMQAYPKELVKIFENHNFVWGGKWGHFDILHFEYRPEVILKARYFSTPIQESSYWYYGVPENEQVKEYINLIDNKLN
ncbi:M15 family metallopeptidase [Clostridium tunisiense]|uniref:M15 family metallopeptidase n=1 Tax=Clostridium tunisiense TaxID=219748 RepID=UPI000318FA1A|nr:M15 family metallopeptidase [Clostridium tunisiense]